MSQYISEKILDRHTVAIEGTEKLACSLTNYATSTDSEWSLTTIYHPMSYISRKNARFNITKFVVSLKQGDALGTTSLSWQLQWFDWLCFDNCHQLDICTHCHQLQLIHRYRYVYMPVGLSNSWSAWYSDHINSPMSLSVYTSLRFVQSDTWVISDMSKLSESISSAGVQAVNEVVVRRRVTRGRVGSAWIPVVLVELGVDKTEHVTGTCL